jgi:hypothetical protein
MVEVCGDVGFSVHAALAKAIKSYAKPFIINALMRYVKVIAVLMLLIKYTLLQAILSAVERGGVSDGPRAMPGMAAQGEGARYFPWGWCIAGLAPARCLSSCKDFWRLPG